MLTPSQEAAKAEILAAVREERNATELDPETLMRRVQIEFHRVEAERA